jgi:dihydrofolate reductase
MRTLSVIEFVTLDGVTQGFGSPDEDREGGFDYGGWGAPYADDLIGKKAGESMATTTAYLFGRRTYEKMAAHWPHQPGSNPMAAHLNAIPKYVITNTLTELAWAGSKPLNGDAAESVKTLKGHGNGTIAVLGSIVLVQTLMEHDLVDDYRLFVHPLVLGTGKKLFRHTNRPMRMQLVDCTPTTTGVLMLHYQPA